MKRKLAIIVAMAVSFTMLLSSFAFAEETTGRVFLALGEDLSESEQQVVMQLFGVNPDECEVIYITNKDEHKYLDDYVDPAQIGTKALSCVMITETDEEGIDVETYNINYCTEDMYENALETIGINNAKVVVAGPYPLSGTAALVGAGKVTEKMTGKRVRDSVMDAAVEELTTTGSLGDEIGNKDAIADIVEDVKEALASNPNMSDDDIIQAIKNAAAKAGISLSDSQIEKIKGMITKFKGLDIDWGSLLDKAKDLGAEGIETAKEMGLWDKIKAWIASLFD